MGGVRRGWLRRLLSFLPPDELLASPSTWSNNTREQTHNSSTTTKTTTTSLTCWRKQQVPATDLLQQPFLWVQIQKLETWIALVIATFNVMSSLAKHSRPNPIFGYWWEPGWPPTKLTIANSEPNPASYCCLIMPIIPIKRLCQWLLCCLIKKEHTMQNSGNIFLKSIQRTGQWHCVFYLIPEAKTCHTT